MEEDEQLKALFIEEFKQRKLSGQVTDDDFAEKYTKFYRYMVNTYKDKILSDLKSDNQKLLKECQDRRHSFNKHLINIWGDAFDLFETFLAVCIEDGMELARDIKPQIPDDKKNLYQALSGLHARGCLIGLEVFTLLLNGYPDGAIARWRTLHEVNVVAKLIADNGDKLAERYLCHDIIKQCKRIGEFQIYCEALGLKPYTDKEIADLMAKRDEMCKPEKFGANFKKDYGWALTVANVNSIKEVESTADFGHMRPYYSFASRNVHAGRDGLDFRLGVPKEGREKLRLVGPSDFGFSEAAGCTAISLTQLTVDLLSSFGPKFWRISNIFVLIELTTEIDSIFSEIEGTLREQYAQKYKSGSD
jgi:hypothetical protein